MRHGGPVGLPAAGPASGRQKEEAAGRKNRERKEDRQARQKVDDWMARTRAFGHRTTRVDPRFRPQDHRSTEHGRSGRVHWIASQGAASQDSTLATVGSDVSTPARRPNKATSLSVLDPAPLHDLLVDFFTPLFSQSGGYSEVRGSQGPAADSPGESARKIYVW
eukprot:Tamp_15317.p1 GENE.Tamp_15317~~Tamp_15317.p1  ORF type:complete len:180 (-),score=1.82 Tamp_15317:1011-1502(-)